LVCIDTDGTRKKISHYYFSKKMAGLWC
jgi:hypothetical protein